MNVDIRKGGLLSNAVFAEDRGKEHERLITPTVGREWGEKLNS